MPVHTFEVRETAHLYRLRVEPSDIDEFGHANNVVWIRWINDASLSHALAVGLSPEACLAMDAIWIVRRHDVEYLLPAFEGQQLECFTWPEVVRGATSVRRCLFRSCADGRVLARAETTWVIVHASTGKPRRVPRDMMVAYSFVSG